MHLRISADSGKGDLLAILKSGLTSPRASNPTISKKIGSERVERAIAGHDAVFQKLRLRNMSMSKFALRSKTLEARDLENAVPTTSASRFVPQGYSAERDDGSYSATPSTGRISLRADRADIEEIVLWASQIIDLLLAEGGVTSAFIRNFARPLELATLSKNVRPTHSSIDASGLEDRLSPGEEKDDPPVRSVQGGFEEVTRTEIDAIKEDLDRVSPSRTTAQRTVSPIPGARFLIGALKVGKTRISLPGFTLPSIEDIFIEHASLAVGTDPRPQTFGPLSRSKISSRSSSAISPSLT